MAKENLEAASRAFRARFQDGSVVNYRVHWSGHIETSWHEDGSPSTIWHPVDTRRCHWSAKGYVIRQVIVVIAGIDYVNPNTSKKFETAHTGEGNIFVVTKLQSENCGQAASRRESDFQNVRNAVNAGLQAIIDSDLETVKNEIRASGDIIEVTAI